MKNWIGIGVIGCLLLICSVCRAQIGGVILDNVTKAGIAASVILEDKDHGHLHVQPSRANGSFFFADTLKAVYLRIKALGYRDTLIPIDFFTSPVVLIPASGYGEEVVVTAERHTTAMQDVPVSVAIVKPAEITGRSGLAVDEALRWIPGVSVTESQVNIRGSSGYGRGVGSRVLFLLDGTPLLAADNGDIKFDVLPMLDIDRIEVVKGAGSSLYGSSAIGGVINIITREPRDTMKTAINTFAGVYDKPKYDEWVVPDLKGRFISTEAGTSGKIGDLGLLGTVAYRHNEGYRLGDDSYKANVFLKALAPLSAAATLTVTGLVANEDHGGWLYWKNLSSPLLPSDSLGAVNGRIHSLKANINASATVLTDALTHSIKANAYYTQFTTDPTTAAGAEGPHSQATNYSLDYTINTDLHPIFVTSGIIGSFQQVTSDLFTDHHGLSFAYFIQGEWQASPLILTLGARADAIRYDSSDWLGRISPKIGASYKLGEEASLRSSFGMGFRAPTISERYIDQEFSGFHIKPNPGLEPERSYTAELGATVHTSNLYLDGALFYSHFNRLIEPSFVTNFADVYIQFLNVTEAELSGHEESIEYKPFSDDRLSLRAGYTYVYAKNITSARELEFRPRHLVQLRAATELGSVSASADFRYISQYQTLDSVLVRQVPDGDARVDAYVIDARIGYDLKNFIGVPLKMTFEVQNLLNYYYVEIVGNLAPLRNYSLRLETVF